MVERTIAMGFSCVEQHIALKNFDEENSIKRITCKLNISSNCLKENL